MVLQQSFGREDTDRASGLRERGGCALRASGRQRRRRGGEIPRDCRCCRRGPRHRALGGRGASAHDRSMAALGRSSHPQGRGSAERPHSAEPADTARSRASGDAERHPRQRSLGGQRSNRPPTKEDRARLLPLPPAAPSRSRYRRPGDAVGLVEKVSRRHAGGDSQTHP